MGDQCESWKLVVNQHRTSEYFIMPIKVWVEAGTLICSMTEKHYL